MNSRKNFQNLHDTFNLYFKILCELLSVGGVWGGEALFEHLFAALVVFLTGALKLFHRGLLLTVALPNEQWELLVRLRVQVWQLLLVRHELGQTRLLLLLEKIQIVSGIIREKEKEKEKRIFRIKYIQLLEMRAHLKLRAECVELWTQWIHLPLKANFFHGGPVSERIQLPQCTIFLF